LPHIGWRLPPKAHGGAEKEDEHQRRGRAVVSWSAAPHDHMIPTESAAVPRQRVTRCRGGCSTWSAGLWVWRKAGGPMPRGRPRKSTDAVLFKSAEMIGWALGGIEREIVATRARLSAL